MLLVGWLVAAVLAVAVLTAWVALTLTRLERLHARVDAAWAALDAQLVRRAAAVQHLLGPAPLLEGLAPERREELAALARAALDPADRDGPTRRLVENGVGRAAVELVTQAGPRTEEGAAVTELREAAARVLVARRFYNNAVRDTRALRDRTLPRVLRGLHVGAHPRPAPDFFDIDDTPPPAAGELVPPTRSPHHAPTTEQDSA